MPLSTSVVRLAAKIGAGTLVVAATLAAIYWQPARPWEASGRLVVLTRSTPDLSATSSLSFTVNDLELLSGDSPRALTLRSRRITVDPRTDTMHVLLDAAAPIGSYEGLRAALSSVGLHPFEDTPLPPVSLRARDLSLALPFQIEEDNTTVILLGFETNQALHATTSGMVYLPTVHVEIRSGATVAETHDAVGAVEGGTILASRMFGMDSTGRMRLNYREPQPAAAQPSTEPPMQQDEPHDTGATSSVTQAEESESDDAASDGVSDEGEPGDDKQRPDSATTSSSS